MAAPDTHDRSKFLGGSDAAGIMGLSPWHTPLQIWMMKTGRAPIEKHDPMRERRYRRGHALEPFICEMSVERLREEGNEVELIARNQRYYDPEFPFISVEIDFELMLNGEHVNADAKSVTGFARKKWGVADTEDVPVEYAVQFATGLMVTNRQTTAVAALKSFDDVDIYWTHRDEEFEKLLRQKLVAFWHDHVLADVPPDPMTYPDTVALFPKDNGQAVEAPDEIYELVMQLGECRRRIRDWGEAEKQLQFDIAEYMRPQTFITYKGQKVLSWKHQSARRVDVDRLRLEYPDVAADVTKITESRVMRLIKPKGQE